MPTAITKQENDMKLFDLSDVISITHDRLVSTRHMDGIYDILNHMTGDNLFTHQLPRAAKICKPEILNQHPHLKSITTWQDEETDGFNEENMKSFIKGWLSTLRAIYGKSLPIKPVECWESRDPFSELASMMRNRNTPAP